MITLSQNGNEKRNGTLKRAQKSQKQNAKKHFSPPQSSQTKISTKFSPAFQSIVLPRRNRRIIKNDQKIQNLDIRSTTCCFFQTQKKWIGINN